MAFDSCGLPINFSITGGEVYDCKEVPSLVDVLPEADYIIADKGYGNEGLRELIKE